MIGTITNKDLQYAIEELKWAAKRHDHFGCSISPEYARALIAYIEQLESEKRNVR